MRIHTLDLRFQGRHGVIAAYLLEDAGAISLIDTGSGSTQESLFTEIRRCGFDPKQVGRVFVTHAHLDHAGVASWFAQHNAQIYCHPNAVRHLTDPARLNDSARTVFGEACDSLWGEMLPTPAERVTALVDGEVVRVGAFELTAWDTPGHARHHHAFVVGDCCFTGDVAGVRLDQSAYFSVAAAPPQFDPNAYMTSLDRLVAANFRRLYLTHFGEVTDVFAHLRAYRERVTEVFERVKAWSAVGTSDREMRIRYGEAESEAAHMCGVGQLLWERYELVCPTSICADGMRLFIEKLGSLNGNTVTN